MIMKSDTLDFFLKTTIINVYTQELYQSRLVKLYLASTARQIHCIDCPKLIFLMGLIPAMNSENN